MLCVMNEMPNLEGRTKVWSCLVFTTIIIYFIWPRREGKCIECNFWAVSSVVLTFFRILLPVTAFFLSFFNLNVKDSEWIFNLAECLIKLQFFIL